MDKFTSQYLRDTWIKFYEERGHVNCGAVSLVSDGSTGVLFNVAGMQPLMPYLLGEKHPKGTRLCNVQGCVRTNDIDSVGDESHVTFFEMMGSWSLGDYFKKERCKWSYELLTEVFGFDRDHLAATVFAGDENAPRDEEGAKCREESGFKKENIFYLPAEDNWWGLEYGPCGPDSEMFFVKDVEDCGPDCKPGCHCGKYTEVGNDVFMQYEKHHDGHLTPLKQQNVDTGWGLERNLAFLNGTSDVYKIDIFAPVIEMLEKASGIKYLSDEKSTRSMRIVADHIRTSVMLIGDEAKLLPSNTGAGYILRRLIRRAVRHARTIGIKTEDLIAIAANYIDVSYKKSYPLLLENRSFILDELKKEIARFESTLENGEKEFNKILNNVKAASKNKIEGKDAFYLYDTFGFPIELTVELANENGMSVDEEGFKASMEEQKQLARDNMSFSQKLSDKDSKVYDEIDASIVSEFIGYDTLSADDKILAIVSGSELKNEIAGGDEAVIITGKTPFYATMGGQLGDIGTIRTENGSFEVTEAVKLPSDRIGHVGKVTEGTIACGDDCSLSVCSDNRAKTCRNHSATHLLQSALQEVLSDSVHQAGSSQDSLRTRFDFSYGQAMSKEEIEKVEKLVNEKIKEGLVVSTEVLSIEDAKKTGAKALFGEKYGDTVRVVSMGEFSKEFCGGTHVKNTAEIKAFKILSESGIAAGTRRIEAITGDNVLSYYAEVEKTLNEAAKAAKCSTADLTDKITKMLAEIKALNSEIESLKSKAAKESLGNVENDIKEVNGVKVIATKVSGVDMNGLRDLGDQLKTKIESGVVVIASETDGKVNLIAMVTDDVIKKGAHAGNLIKEISGLVGGGGGGRPNMAQAGGKNPAGIDECLVKAVSVIESQTK
ncbi:MAG: alanine--tRNA ligase [Lachnospiraceae bacterium]|nr:alanine--tRNA ligase [Lachnospiraceae bacterium]